MDLEQKLKQTGEKKIALVGNPNVGKSVIFGLLTGQYVTVSNYPGTTIEVTTGKLLSAHKDRPSVTIIDTPGINNLIPDSEDERVTRDILATEDISYVIQVGDAKNLRRALFVSLQLSEMGLPYLLALNMTDEARSLGIKIHPASLSRLIGAPVISTVAVERRGIKRLVRILQEEVGANPGVRPYQGRHVGLPLQRDDSQTTGLSVTYDSLIESAINRISGLLPESHVSRRFRALVWLAGDDTLDRSTPELINIRNELAKHFVHPLSYIINIARLQRVDEVVTQINQPGTATGYTLSGILGRITMHPVWGIPFLLLSLFLLYEVVGVFGAGTLVDFMQKFIFGKYINPSAVWLFSKIIPFPAVADFFTGNYGLVTMALSYGFAIVLPIVATFFLAFGLLEDSGYLPRLAIMVNRLFKLVGLNGKAVLPMVLGLGCGTMATMTTRILPSKKERVITTLLLALGVPCSAQLGIIMGMLGGISWQAVLWLFVPIVVITASVGFLANKILIGDCSDFIMEIPPIRRPAITNILTKTFARVKWYLKEVIPIFILGTAILWILDKTGFLTMTEQFVRPVVKGMLGLPESTTPDFLIGFFRRDYGAAGIYSLAKQGLLTQQQIVVALLTLTLFVPCFAQFLMMVKERGWKTALAISAFVFTMAILVGSFVNLLLNLFSSLK